MFSTQRQAEILRIVRAKQTCTVTELAEALAVSDETIRRDVKPLIGERLLVKVHGGVMLPALLEEPPFQRRMVENRAGKKAIATLACELVQDGDALILDGGTTCMHIAQALSVRSRLTVVTNSAEVARTLAPRHGNRVFLAGGELRADDSAAFGESTLAFLRQFHVRHAIVSVTAVDAFGRFMDAQPADVAYSHVAFAQAERRVVAADHSKFGRSALVHAFGADGVDLLLTDEAPTAELAEVFATAGLEVAIGMPVAAAHGDEAGAAS